MGFQQAIRMLLHSRAASHRFFPSTVAVAFAGRRRRRLWATSLAAALHAGAVMAADISVMDGHTIRLDGRTVKLWGIEAPRAGETCTTTAGQSWPCGDRARHQLREALAEGADCQSMGTAMVRCRVAGLDVGLLLVKEGLAKASADYQEAEIRARAARVGLWQ